MAVTEVPYRVQARLDTGEEEGTMAIHENGPPLASDGAPLGNKEAKPELAHHGISGLTGATGAVF